MIPINNDKEAPTRKLNFHREIKLFLKLTINCH